MAVVKIVTVPNKKLSTKCEKITDFGKKTTELTQNLLDTVRAARDPEGAGLAAPQIGVLKRICVVRKYTVSKEDNETVNIEDYVLINPEILKKSKDTALGWEACLSIPGVYAQIERAKKVKVKALDEKGKQINLNASGFFARVIQHEIDHLNGILITDINVDRKSVG